MRSSSRLKRAALVVVLCSSCGRNVAPVVDSGSPDGGDPVSQDAGGMSCPLASVRLDIDKDGVVDECDEDIDNDGIPNSTDTDRDGDGIDNNNDPNSRELTSPSIVISTGPLPATQSVATNTVVSFSCDAEGCLALCSLDGAAEKPCNSPLPLSGLSVGEHELRIRGTHTVGGIGRESTRTWRVQAMALSFGSGYSCVLRGDGTRACWGNNELGQLGDGTFDNQAALKRQTSEGSWSTISSGTRHTCGVRSGELYCWGMGSAFGFSGSAWVATPQRIGSDHDWAAVSGGFLHTCAIKTNGALYCFGYNGARQTGTAGFIEEQPARVAGDSQWIDVGTGLVHSCGVRFDGSLYCWGGNGSGEAAGGQQARLAVPTRIGSDNDWVDVDVEFQSSCALKKSGALYCWGHNPLGRVVAGGPEILSTPTQVPSEVPFASFAAGGGGIQLALTRAGELYCWGDSPFGICGDGSVDPVNRPRKATTGLWDRVWAGVGTACGLQAGDLLCWGRNADGSIGRNEFSRRTTPVPVGDANDWSHVAAVGHTTFGIRSGELYKWGMAEAYLAGDLSLTHQPTRVGAATGWTAIAGGGSAVCGIESGRLWCWGENSTGQVGDGTNERRLVPTQVGNDADWAEVRVGDQHSCGLKVSGALYCWGVGTSGQLGSGPAQTNSLAPVRVGSHSTWRQVSLGVLHTCATQSDNTLSCWGDNRTGQLGLDNVSNSFVPSQVGGSQWQQVATRQAYTCAISTTGELHCWGNNRDGQLGTGDKDSRTTPTHVGIESAWKRVATGLSTTCAIKTTGELACWGNNEFGQLGNGTMRERLTPTTVEGFGDWSEVAIGYRHVCARRGGRLYCWGDNETSQLGFRSSFFPTAAPVVWQ